MTQMQQDAFTTALPGMGSTNVGVDVPSGLAMVTCAVPALTSCTYTPQQMIDGTNWYAISYDAFGQAGQKTTYTGSANLTYRVAPGGKFRLITNTAGNDTIKPVIMFHSGW